MADGGGRVRDAMRIVLDGNDLEVRAYLASQIGPTRRPFGTVRPNPVAAGVPKLVASARSGAVLYVGLESTVTTNIAVAKNNTPAINQSITFLFTANVTFEDFVLLPGEELWVRPAAATIVIATEVTF